MQQILPYSRRTLLAVTLQRMQAMATLATDMLRNALKTSSLMLCPLPALLISYHQTRLATVQQVLPVPPEFIRLRRVRFRRLQATTAIAITPPCNQRPPNRLHIPP